VGRAQTYLRLGRVSNLPTVWTNVLAAIVLAGGALDGRVLAPLVVACSCFYAGGMFLNDAFDREHDASEQPHRPIPSGEIAASEVFAVGFALLAIGIATVGLSATLAGHGAAKPVASSASLGAAVVAYDLWHKRNPLSPVLMATCRVLVYVTAALVVGEVTAAVLIGAACLFSYMIALTDVAKYEGEGSVAWPVVLLFVPLVPTAPLVRDVAGVIVWLGLLLWLVRQVDHLVQRQGGRVVAPLIAGISLVDATLIANAGKPYLAMFTVVGFAATLGLQRWVRGT